MLELGFRITDAFPWPGGSSQSTSRTSIAKHPKPSREEHGHRRRTTDALTRQPAPSETYQLGLPSHAGLSVRRVRPEPSGFIT